MKRRLRKLIAHVLIRERISSFAHRAGFFVFVLLAVAAGATAISAWYSNHGPILTDLTAGGTERVITSTMTTPLSTRIEPQRARIRLDSEEAFARSSLDSGTIRIFFLYWVDQVDLQPGGKAHENAVDTAFSNLEAWERRRGEILLPDEQPVLVGNVLLQEVFAERRQIDRGWSHLKHGLDWGRLHWAGVIGLFALASYPLFWLLCTFAYVAGRLRFVPVRAADKSIKVVAQLHNYGLALALLLGLIALGTATSVFLSNGGSVLKDPEATTDRPIITATAVETFDAFVEVSRARIRKGETERIGTANLNTGTIRKFAFYDADRKMLRPTTFDKEKIDDAFRNLMAWERQRGEVVLPAEQPILVGNVFLQETGQRTGAAWTHLKHSLNWRRIGLAIAIAEFAMLLLPLIWLVRGVNPEFAGGTTDSRIYLRRDPGKDKVVNQAHSGIIDTLTAIVLGLTPVFFLTVRSWTNGALLILLILAVCGAWQRPKAYRDLLKDRWVRLILITMAAPFLAVLASQVLRGEIFTPTYDGPFRILVGAAVFIHLTARRIDFVRLFQWTFPISLFVLAVSLQIDSSGTEYWKRLATYFVDPLTLGQYSLFVGFCSFLSIDLVDKDPPWARFLKISAALVGLAISLSTAARSSWVALPAFYCIWLIRLQPRHPARTAAISALVIAVTFLSLYYLDRLFASRVHSTISELADYFRSGNSHTSVGMRLTLMRISWELFLANPLYGYGDANFPALSSIPAIVPYYTPELETVLTANGAHNELFQNLLRSGIFGLISMMLLIVGPFILFARHVITIDKRVRSAALFGMAYIAALFFFGLATETLALKYLNTFYAIMVAAAAAQILWARETSHLKESQRR